MYTGSMMLISGMQIITSSRLDTRKTFIIGISLFLGISRELFPAYYNSLPPFINPFTGTFLSITTVCSILLNAIFRIKQKDMTILEIGDSPEKIEKIIQRDINKWGGDVEDAKSTSLFVKSICRMISESGYADGMIKASITANDVELRVELNYTGKMLYIPIKRLETEEEMLEEMPMARGLTGFLTGVYPDRVVCTANNTDCRIILIFEL